MNHQRIHRFCLALMFVAMLVRLAGQVQAYLDWEHSLAPTLWRVDIDAAPTELVCRTPLPAGLSPVSSAAPEADEPSGELPAASEEDAAPEEPSQNAPAEPSEPLTFSPEEADGMIAGASITEERKASGWIFSDGYYNATQSMTVAADSDITGFDGLKGKDVAVKTGTQGAAYAESLKDQYGFNIVYFEDSPTMYQAVLGGQCVACFEDTPIMQATIKDGGRRPPGAPADRKPDDLPGL